MKSSFTRKISSGDDSTDELMKLINIKTCYIRTLAFAISYWVLARLENFEKLIRKNNKYLKLLKFDLEKKKRTLMFKSNNNKNKHLKKSKLRTLRNAAKLSVLLSFLFYCKFVEMCRVSKCFCCCCC